MDSIVMFALVASGALLLVAHVWMVVVDDLAGGMKR
jgi:hypothetical protein